MTVLKVDALQRLVFGWAQVDTVGGEDYYDSDNQHIPADVTFKAWSDFMRGPVRAHKAMHAGEPVGDVVFAFPLLGDIPESLGLGDLPKTGVVVGVYVPDDGMLLKYISGEYTGFSVGGSAQWEDEE